MIVVYIWYNCRMIVERSYMVIYVQCIIATFERAGLFFGIVSIKHIHIDIKFFNSP